MRNFTVLWAGYLVSIFGTALTSFALGVWVFQESGSVTQFGLVFVMSLLPGVLVAPLAGVLVDRWNRWVVLLIGDVVGIATTLTLALLYLAGVLDLWHILVTTAVRSVLRAMYTPALNSVVVLLAPKEQVGRANGLVLLAHSLSQVIAPVLGGVLLLSAGLNAVLLVDCASFIVNVAILLLFIRIPRPPASAAGSVGKGSLMGEMGQGWRYLRSRRGLVGLLAFYASLCFTVGFVDVIITPLVVSFASAAALGVVLALAGAGLLVGSVTLTAWGGPRRRIHALAGFAVPLGLFMVLGSLRPSVPLIAAAAFGVMFCSMIIDGTTRSVLQLEVEPDLQGRTFAAFDMVTNGLQCTAYLAAGPIADYVFEPLMREGGPLASTFGAVLGVGPGRGMALFVLVIGAVLLLTAVVGYLQPSLRGLTDRPSGGAPAETAEETPAAFDPAPVPGVEPAAVHAGQVPDAAGSPVPDRR